MHESVILCIHFEKNMYLSSKEKDISLFGCCIIQKFYVNLHPGLCPQARRYI
jgi:hypothetical protein